MNVNVQIRSGDFWLTSGVLGTPGSQPLLNDIQGLAANMESSKTKIADCVDKIQSLLLT